MTAKMAKEGENIEENVKMASAKKMAASAWRKSKKLSGEAWRKA
jgi:hypothetical protein